MNTNTPKTDRLARRFARLNFAALAFCQCRALTEHMLEEHLDVFSPLFTPQIAGIVVTYAKNFVSAEGFGALQEPFNSFTDPELSDTHQKLLHARHKLYAHRDATAAQSFTYDDPGSSIPYDVRIELKKGDTTFTALPNVPELNPQILPFIARLCIFQVSRVVDEFKRIIPLMTDGKTYKAGTYTIGVDFP